jgi:hypothetical protein
MHNPPGTGKGAASRPDAGPHHNVTGAAGARVQQTDESSWKRAPGPDDPAEITDRLRLCV